VDLLESLDDTDTLATAGWGVVTATLIEPDVPRSTTDAAAPDDGMSGNARSSTRRSNVVSSTSSVIVVGILVGLPPTHSPPHGNILPRRHVTWARLPQWAIDGYREVTQQSTEAERQQLIEQANAT
jgi:hypothetical protein